MTHRHVQQAGFTLVEIGIVIVIIGLLLGAILKGESLLDSGRVHDIVVISQDLSSAIREFKQRYHMYPGDMLINATTPEIPGVGAPCLAGGANAGNRNGIIDGSESPCVPEALGRAGLIGKALIDPVTGLYTINTYYGRGSVIASSGSGVTMPPTVLYVLQLTNVPCDIAMQIDRKMDDGNLATGNVRASIAACTPQDPATDPVPSLALGL